MKNERLLVIVILWILKIQQVNPIYVPIKVFAIAILIETKSDAIMIAMPTTVLKSAIWSFIVIVAINRFNASSQVAYLWFQPPLSQLGRLLRKMDSEGIDSNL